MSRKYLLPQSGNFYKANLHCHSTNSDGRYTVQHLKEIYMSKGYSIIAFSDHNKLIPHKELQDENFLPITATEINIDGKQPWPDTLTYHINFYSKDQDRKEFVPFTNKYDTDCVNKLISDASKAGFLVQYNHPRWSFQTPSDFLPLENLWGFEVFNTGCEVEMLDGWGDYEYEALCRDFYANRKDLPAPIATDDNHNAHMDEDSPFNDSFGGWIMVKAERLDYISVMDALENKSLYASTGPEIYELYKEDNKVFVKHSPSCTVALLTNSRPTSILQSHDNNMTCSELNIPENTKWFRIEIADKAGKRAITRAYIND